jgi:transketolase
VTLHNCLPAADQLGRDGIRARVLDLYSLKPIDTQALLEAASATSDRHMVAEDHYPADGIGSAVLEAFNDAGHSVASATWQSVICSAAGPQKNS